VSGGYSSTAGLHFDDQEFESQIVWVWTTARSGSTWLLRMLSHPLKLVDSSHDPDDLLGFVAPRTWQGKVDVIPVDTTFVSNHLVPLAGSADYSDDFSPRTFSSALGLRNRANYFFSPKYADVWRPEVRRMMLVRFHRFLERTAERYETHDPLLVLKEVAGAHAAPLVMSMFPRSKMVFLVRDGRDVVDSQTAANQPGGWLPVTGWRTSEERLEFIRRRARTWVGDVTSIEKAFQSHPAELRKMLRYEDLLAEATQPLGSLVEFLGLRRSERWLDRAVEANAFESIPPEQKGPKKFFRSATAGAWRTNMSEEESSILGEVTGEKLVELGYPVDHGPQDRDLPSNRAMPPESPPMSDVVSAWTKRAGAGRDFSNLAGLVARRGSPTSRRDRKIALTFDDGPGLETYRVIETLERYGARGTFFLVGHKVEGHEEVVLRLTSGGHEIGNHSYGHSPFASRDDLAACSAVIDHVAGEPPRVFRPPFGAIDREGAQAAIDEGMSVILWTVDSKDAIPPWIGTSAEQITRNVLGSVSPGAIVLLHDCLSWSRAADAVPDLVEQLVGRGYELVTVSALLEDRSLERSAPKGPLVRRLARARGGMTEPMRARATRRRCPLADVAERPTVDRRDQLLRLIERLADEVEPLPDEDEPGARLIRGAIVGLDRRIDHDLLLRHTAAYDTKALLILSLGFSLRRFEHERGAAAGLPEDLAARLQAADDWSAEAGRIAEDLAGPRRYKRLIAARMASQTAMPPSDATPPGTGEVSDPPEDAPHSATTEFLAIFAPGPDVWQELETWARSTGRRVARQRNRALLDAAGIDASFDIAPAVDRLDVDFLFRFGYALAACGEELSPPDS
jgi:peptidoglycan/xylan/chitin deacetylase (PgdA/CDA1 family)